MRTFLKTSKRWVKALTLEVSVTGGTESERFGEVERVKQEFFGIRFNADEVVSNGSDTLVVRSNAEFARRPEHVSSHRRPALYSPQPREVGHWREHQVKAGLWYM